MSSCRNESILKPKTLEIFLHNFLSSSHCCYYSYAGRKIHMQGEKNQGKTNKCPIARDYKLRDVKIFPPTPHPQIPSYLFLLNELILLPAFLTRCSCYWLTEMSNYEKSTFFDFQRIGGVSILDTTSLACNLCNKVQTTMDKSSHGE